jgi:hypothetical protein
MKVPDPGIREQITANTSHAEGSTAAGCGCPRIFELANIPKRIHRWGNSVDRPL